jgi:hypothetical protein
MANLPKSLGDMKEVIAENKAEDAYRNRNWGKDKERILAMGKKPV